MHRVVANGSHRGRPRFMRALAFAVIAQLTWLVRRRGSLRRQVARSHVSHEHHLEGLPVYLDGPKSPRADGRPSVSVVVPALNEADSIGWVLQNIPAWVDEVILVDGLSIDRTEVVARSLVPNLVVVHQRARGKGAALRAGFHAARGDIIAMIDADGSTDPRELGRFVDALVGGADFAKGSREMAGGGSVDFTPLRRAGNIAFVKLANIMYGTHFTDLLYGYCAFWRDYLDDLQLSADGFEIETQLVVNAVKAGLTVAEVPSVELERRAGASNLNALSDGLRILETMLLEHPHLGDPLPGEVFEMVEVQTPEPDLPEWRPAGSDKRNYGDRRAGQRGGDGPDYIGPERRASDERRLPVQRTVRVLVPRRGDDGHQNVTELADHRESERRTGADRRQREMTAEATALVASLGSRSELSADQLPRAVND
jgi:glycosyltransferase involved in cell wall biosynthesis